MTEHLVDDFPTNTIAILVFFLGVYLNKKVRFLRDFNIPEPVTGGLLAATVAFVWYSLTGVAIVFDLGARDQLLVYFFTGIGLNARISDLARGGRPLVVLLVLTLLFMVAQNAIGLAGATLVGVPAAVGVLAGSASLIGGHGTAIAWAPDVAKLGVDGALEIGVACATLGLVIASLIGGPIARRLIRRHDLAATESTPVVGIAYDQADKETINHINLMAVLLTLHVTIILGYFANRAIASVGFKLPLFVTCLLVGILLSNVMPRWFPRIRWPARTRALAVVSDFSLGLFLSMSLMSLQLWTIAELAGPLLVILALQALGAFAYILWVIFPLMGRDYQAAVLSAGFGGFALGATPTAIANMTAVTKTHGPAPVAFLILPLVAAFFVDVANALIIKFALSF